MPDEDCGMRRYITMDDTENRVGTNPKRKNTIKNANFRHLPSDGEPAMTLGDSYGLWVIGYARTAGQQRRPIPHFDQRRRVVKCSEVTKRMWILTRRQFHRVKRRHENDWRHLRRCWLLRLGHSRYQLFRIAPMPHSGSRRPSAHRQHSCRWLLYCGRLSRAKSDAGRTLDGINLSILQFATVLPTFKGDGEWPLPPFWPTRQLARLCGLPKRRQRSIFVALRNPKRRRVAALQRK